MDMDTVQIATDPSGVDPLVIRPYRSDDADATLAVFIAAITVTAAYDYSPLQVSAWARPEKRNVSDWNRGMVTRDSFVAVIGDEIAGFSDVSAGGYIDMMFVSPHFARRGVATALISLLESRARTSGARQLSADVSITARPFFESQGFAVEAVQHPITAGVQMTNFRMTKALVDSR
jgi:putative acetyltransferase